MLPLVIAIAALAVCALPGVGLFVGLGLGIAGLGLGLRGTRLGSGASRLACAGAATIALIAVGLATARYAVTLAALDHLIVLADAR